MKEKKKKQKTSRRNMGKSSINFKIQLVSIGNFIKWFLTKIYDGSKSNGKEKEVKRGKLRITPMP